MLRTAPALRAGVHPRDLYALRDAGVLELVSRGVYRLAGLPPLAEPDLVTVAARVPRAVIALVSALHFHGLTTEIPHEVSIALPKGTARPRLDWPPLRVYWLSAAMFTSDIEIHERDGVRLRVYGPAKTVADCFKFRNQLGIDVALEALRTGLEERKFTPAEVLRVARTCRVDRIVRPYLEALQ
ncbi:MAG: type IV toxin-antitoxin system AbiEi family antitoxin domain-containing protein [candidate division NC10 bacterium]